MSGRKIARVDRFGPHPPSRLLHHWHFLHDQLVPYLATPDLIALLWTHRTFKDDGEIGQRVFDATRDFATHLLLGCPSDWCAPVPSFHWEHPDEPRCGYAHHVESDNEGDDNDDEDRPRLPTTLDAMMGLWQAKVGSSDRCAALLTLASLMATDLGSLLYSRETPIVTSYTIVPFILPLSRLEEIARSHPPPGPATALGCHLENVTGGEVGPQVGCALCAACFFADKEAEEYEERRETDEAAFEQRLRDDGYGSDSDEYDTRMEEYQTRMAVLDEFYEVDHFHEKLGTIIAGWCKEGKLPPLHLIDQVTGDDLRNVVNSSFYRTIYSHPSGSFCEDWLRPLVAFFRRNGFGQIHRAVLPREQFESVDGKYAKEEIRRVEMAGAEAPHGFYAGVYYVERYT